MMQRRPYGHPPRRPQEGAKRPGLERIMLAILGFQPIQLGAQGNGFSARAQGQAVLMKGTPLQRQGFKPKAQRTPRGRRSPFRKAAPVEPGSKSQCAKSVMSSQPSRINAHTEQVVHLSDWPVQREMGLQEGIHFRLHPLNLREAREAHQKRQTRCHRLIVWDVSGVVGGSSRSRFMS